MKNTVRIQIGTDGFIDPPGSSDARFRVKEGQSVVFDLVEGVRQASVAFDDGVGPFGVSPLQLTTGSGPYSPRPGTAGQRYPMRATILGATDVATLSEPTDSVESGGSTGELDVEPP